ncbi:GNAT family N-acetyltransferase [Chloroflexota bacterium]|nr:GNAT family N-acetyltransferase [Chloroflexota bacterium]
MTYTFQTYSHSQKEFQEICDLLNETYLQDHRPRNWRLALIENWNMASRFLEPREYFIDRVRLWRDPDDRLAGFVIKGIKLVHPQTRSNDPALLGEILAWVVEHWASPDRTTSVMAYDWDTRRQVVLLQNGYEPVRVIEEVRIYDLNEAYPEPYLPEGFRFSSVADERNPQARVALENAIWEAQLDEAWYRGKSSSPHYFPNLDLLVISPEGQSAAAALVWPYPETGAGEIDPLGTHPDFRRLGLARAIVLHSFKQMQALGLHLAYIASDVENQVVNTLYDSLNPAEVYQGILWSKVI